MPLVNLERMSRTLRPKVRCSRFFLLPSRISPAIDKIPILMPYNKTRAINENSCHR